MASVLERKIADMRQSLIRALYDINRATSEAELKDLSLIHAESILGAARSVSGIACHSCGGAGEKGYANTATWSGGVGGQSMTQDVCDSCWGTGRSDKKNPSLKILSLLWKWAREPTEDFSLAVGARADSFIEGVNFSKNFVSMVLKKITRGM